MSTLQPPFTTATDAAAYIERFANRAPDVSESLPARARQAARYPEMGELLALLDNPQDAFRAAHIAGTSGKGSTATLLASILRAAGLHVGLYTNPYVTVPQERIQIAGQHIADDRFVECVNLVALAIARYQMRWPEHHLHLKQVWVAVALLAFKLAMVDIAVIETGMGGRWDETNIVRSSVSIITTIDFDHMEFLGATLPEIAWQKAGIIRPTTPVVTGVTTPEALAVIHAEATMEHAPLAILGVDFAVAAVAVTSGGTRFTYIEEYPPSLDPQVDMPRPTLTGEHLPWRIIPDLELTLSGEHQAMNAALAIRAAGVVLPNLPEAAIRAGARAAWMPGRFEIVAHDPLLVLDVAHNPEKMRALVATLRTTQQWDRLIVIFGALGGKEVQGMLRILAPLSPQIIVTTPSVSGRIAMAATRIAAAASALGMAAAIAASPAAALAMARQHAGPRDLILVTGSLFLVSQIRALATGTC